MVYDAFALFTGHRAASVPGARRDLGRCWRSAALAAVGWGARPRGLAGARAGGTAGAWLARLGLLLVALGVVCQSPTDWCCRASTVVPPDAGGGDPAGLRAGDPAARARRPRLRVGLLAAATARACGGLDRGARAAARCCATPPTSGRRSARWRCARCRPDAASARRHRGRAPRRRGRSAAARRGPRRPQADVLLITIDALALRSRRRLRLRPPHDAQHRRARREADAVLARLLAGAAHLVLGVVDADVEVLPDDGAAGAGRAARPDRRRAAQLRLEDGGVLSAGGLLHRLRQAEDLRRDQLRLRVRQVRVHRRPAPRRPAAGLLRHRQAPALVRLGPLLRAARALRGARRVSRSARATSIATTARSPTPTPRSGGWSRRCAPGGRGRS